MSISVGDKVAYSVQFLRSIGMSHSDMAHARGQVTELKALSAECILARIAWQGNQELPERVNVKNLAKVGANRQFCNCD